MAAPGSSTQPGPSAFSTVVDMTTVPTVEALIASAIRFSKTALDAYHVSDHQRVAVDAGTALEHLAKACLASRSPVLLVELKSGQNRWPSLALLAGFPVRGPNQLRTVGLRDALTRVKSYVTSLASDADLKLLVDLRDGVVHAALNDEVGEQVLVAFLQQTDSLLAGMGRDRADFWGDRLDVVDALLADATDKVEGLVRLKLAVARAAFERMYADMPIDVRQYIEGMPPTFDEMTQALVDCPACGSQTAASGVHSVEVDGEYDEDGYPHAWAWVVFAPAALVCWRCGLQLDSQAEMLAAGLLKEWSLPDLDASMFHAPEYYDDI